jgi:fission process protein 1
MLASLIVPTLAIHSIVHQAHAVTKRTGRFTKWGPTVAGLVFIPALPYAVDEPIEHAVDYCFDKYWPVVVAAEAKEAKEASEKKQQ